MKPAVLYITYDGVLEPLGQSQVVSYLERLGTEFRIQLVSFEKEAVRKEAAGVAAMRERLCAAGIAWTPLVYHKTPSAPATAYDIGIGTVVGIGVALRYQCQIVHARSYVPSLMALGVKRATGARFIFDMRGFWADERVDGGIWPRGGCLYRTAKRLERSFFRAADQVVTLTEASIPKIEDFGYSDGSLPPINVIPTCADLDSFVMPAAPPAPEPFVFGYVGSFGTWYLIDETMALFRAILDRRSDARMLIVNRHEHEAVRAAAALAGIPADRIEIHSAPHAEVAAHIQRMHAASALIRPCFSKISSAPTKLAEYLGCGVPCVGNIGVGDMAAILEGDGIGVALRSFDAVALRSAAERILALSADPAVRARCRTAALSRFSLTSGVAAYRSIYARLASIV